MVYDNVNEWLQVMANRYPGLTVYEFPPERFIEDNKGHYLGLVPIKNSKNGYDDVTERENANMLILLSRYYAIWRLPKIDQDIITDVIKETAKIGSVKSVTTDIRFIHQQLYKEDNEYVPGGDRSFVAVEVETGLNIIMTKNPCECLLKCFL
jgi:hypothetical protein